MVRFMIKIKNRVNFQVMVGLWCGRVIIVLRLILGLGLGLRLFFLLS
jgi:hypothetical protein